MIYGVLNLKFKNLAMRSTKPFPCLRLYYVFLYSKQKFNSCNLDAIAKCTFLNLIKKDNFKGYVKFMLNSINSLNSLIFLIYALNG